MFGLKSVIALLATLAAASPAGGSLPFPTPLPGCGQVNVIFVGLPPNHPLVTAQGFNSTLVNGALRADAAAIIRAGYNLKVVLFGPEQPISVLENEMNGYNWGDAGVGFGVRGSPRVDLTIELEQIIATYRQKAPFAKFVFNNSPTSGLAALQRNTPLSSNCTTSPGKDLGFKIYCDICN